MIRAPHVATEAGQSTQDLISELRVAGHEVVGVKICDRAHRVSRNAEARAHEAVLEYPGLTDLAALLGVLRVVAARCWSPASLLTLSLVADASARVASR
jgi:hypothetical protein